MTPSELMADLNRCGPQELYVVLQYFANHLHEITLANGCHVRDASDCKAFLRECAEATRAPSPPRPRDHTCPDCGHEHEGRHECKAYIGEGRFCPCESKVTA